VSVLVNLGEIHSEKWLKIDFSSQKRDKIPFRVKIYFSVACAQLNCSVVNHCWSISSNIWVVFVHLGDVRGENQLKINFLARKRQKNTFPHKIFLKFFGFRLIRYISISHKILKRIGENFIFYS